MILSLFSLIGLPMFSGYISKDIVKYSVKDFGIAYLLFSFINIGTLIYTLKFLQIFKGKGTKYNINIKTKISFLILLIPALILGLNPTFIENIFMIKIDYFFGNPNIIMIFEYFIFVVLAIFINKNYVEKEHKILYKLRHFNLSFENSVFLLVIFLFSLISFNFII